MAVSMHALLHVCTALASSQRACALQLCMYQAMSVSCACQLTRDPACAASVWFNYLGSRTKFWLTASFNIGGFFLTLLFMPDPLRVSLTEASCPALCTPWPGKAAPMLRCTGCQCYARQCHMPHPCRALHTAPCCSWQAARWPVPAAWVCSA